VLVEILLAFVWAVLVVVVNTPSRVAMSTPSTVPPTVKSPTTFTVPPFATVSLWLPSVKSATCVLLLLALVDNKSILPLLLYEEYMLKVDAPFILGVSKPPTIKVWLVVAPLSATLSKVSVSLYDVK
jgi:hypothetical protein